MNSNILLEVKRLLKERDEWLRREKEKEIILNEGSKKVVCLVEYEVVGEGTDNEEWNMEEFTPICKLDVLLRVFEYFENNDLPFIEDEEFQAEYKKLSEKLFG